MDSTQTADSTTTLSNTATDWRSSLSEDLRENPSLRDFKDINGLAKSYVHAQSLVGGEKIPLPKPDDVEGWKNVYSKLGRPETPNEYGFAKPEDFPENIPWDDEAVNLFAKEMHDAGLSKAQASKLFETYNKNTLGKIQAFNEQKAKQEEQGINSLKQEWADKFNENAQIANKALKHYGGEEVAKTITESGLGNNAAFLKMFHKLGQNLNEDSSIGLNQSSNNLNPSLAKSQKANLLSDPLFSKAYYDASHPNHDDSVKQISDLDRIVYGAF